MTFRPAAPSFGVGFFLAALAIAGSPAAAQIAPLNPRVAIKVGAIGAVSDAGIFIAQEKGYFKDEGLDVELVSFKAAPQILPAIATGEVQVSGSAVTPALFNAFARGIGMKLVADKGQVAKGFGFAAIVIRSDLTDTVKDFKDLKGRKFAVMGRASPAPPSSARRSSSAELSRAKSNSSSSDCPKWLPRWATRRSTAPRCSSRSSRLRPCATSRSAGRGWKSFSPSPVRTA